MHERKADIVAHAMEAPDFADRNLVVFAQAACHIDHRRRNVEMKIGAHSRELSPFSERFKMIDRFASFDLDDRLQSTAAIEGVQDQVGKNDGSARAHGDVLLGSRVDPGLILPPVLRLQQTNNAVVLELLADWPDQNRAHLAPPNSRINTW